MREKSYIGLDVDSKGVEIAETSDGETYANSRLTLGVFETWLRHHADDVLAVEYTGRLAEPYLNLCQKAGVQIFIIHARARHASQHFGRDVAKTDPQDARAIARTLLLWHDEKSRKLLLWPDDLFTSGSSVRIAWELRSLLEARDRYVADAARMQNRATAAERSGNRDLFEFFSGEANRLKPEPLDKKIAEFVENHFPEHSANLLAVPGFGAVISARLIATLLPVERFRDVKSVLGYVGFAQVIRESGGLQLARRRTRDTGHGELRALLYLAALGQCKAENDHGRFYRQLVARGKPGKVALVALASKLLREAFAILLKGTSREFEDASTARAKKQWPPGLVTQAQYARQVGLTRQRISQLVAEDKLPTAVHGGKKLIDLSKLGGNSE